MTISPTFKVSASTEYSNLELILVSLGLDCSVILPSILLNRFSFPLDVQEIGILLYRCPLNSIMLGEHVGTVWRYLTKVWFMCRMFVYLESNIWKNYVELSLLGHWTCRTQQYLFETCWVRVWFNRKTFIEHLQKNAVWSQPKMLYGLIVCGHNLQATGPTSFANAGSSVAKLWLGPFDHMFSSHEFWFVGFSCTMKVIIRTFLMMKFERVGWQMPLPLSSRLLPTFFVWNLFQQVVLETTY